MSWNWRHVEDCFFSGVARGNKVVLKFVNGGVVGKTDLATVVLQTTEKNISVMVFIFAIQGSSLISVGVLVGDVLPRYPQHAIVSSAKFYPLMKTRT